MNTEKITLYVDSNFFSPYAMSVFVGLEVKIIPFTMEQIDLTAKENLQDEYAHRSLTCRVPTLLHGAFSLSESSAITEYLEEVYPPPDFSPLYPADLHDRSRARQIQAWLRSDLSAIREERSTEVIFANKCNPQPLSEDAEKAANKLFAALDNLVDDNADNLFDQWCIADTEIALMLNRLIMNGDQVPEKLINYASHQWQRASVQKWVGLSKGK